MATTTEISPLNISRYLLEGDEVPEQNLPQIVTPRIRSNQVPLQPVEPTVGDFVKNYNANILPKVQEQNTKIAAETIARNKGLVELANELLTPDYNTPVVGLGEAVISTVTGIGAFFAGLGSVGSSILNEAGQAIAQHGPITAQTPGELIRANTKPDFYTGLKKDFNAVMEKYNYSPRTESGQQLMKVITLLPHLIQGGAEKGKEGLIALGTRPDDAEAISLSLEFLGFMAIDPGIRAIANKYKSTVAKFNSTTNKSTIDADLTKPENIKAANALAKIANTPETQVALAEARLNLVDTLRAIPGQSTNIFNSIRASKEIEQTLTETVAPAPNVNPQLLPQIRSLGQDIVRRLEQNPDNTATIADAAKFIERTNGSADPAIATLRTRISEDVPVSAKAIIEPGPENPPPPIRRQIDLALDPQTPPTVVKETLTNIKSQIQQTLKPGETLESGLETQGISAEVAAVVAPKLRATRISRVPTIDAPPTPGVNPEIDFKRAFNIGDVIGENYIDALYDRFVKGIKNGPPDTGLDVANALRTRGIEISDDRFATIIRDVNDLRTKIDTEKLNFGQTIADYANSLYNELSSIPNATPAIIKSVRPVHKKTIQSPVPTESTGEPLTERVRLAEAAITDSNSSVPLVQRVREFRAATEEATKASQDIVSTISSPALTSPSSTILETGINIAPKTISYESVRPNSLVQSLSLPEEVPLNTAPTHVPLQIRRSDGIPDALIVDITGLTTTTPHADIQAQLGRRRNPLSPAVAQALEDNLRRQAELAGVPIEEAHKYSGEQLLEQAKQIALERNLELYQAKRTKGGGIEYEQIPHEFLQVEKAMREGTELAPKKISPEQASTYLAEKTKSVGEVTLEEIQRSLEEGTDIGDRLPPDIRPHYQDVLDRARSGIDSSELRTFIEVLQDLREFFAPSDGGSAFRNGPGGQQGSLSLFGTTPNQRAAARRLKADALKTGIKLRELIDRENIPEAEKILLLRYLEQANIPRPPSGVEPYEMRLDPNAAAQGDFVSSQRKYKDTNYAPVYYSEALALQLAGPAKTNFMGMDQLYYVLRKAELHNPIGRAYRATQRGLDIEKGELNRDLSKLSHVIDREARDNIGRYSYTQQPNGARILRFSGKEPIDTLTPNEQVVYVAGRTLFNDLLQRMNDVRDATGKKRIDPIDDYVPFMRSFMLQDKLDHGSNLLFDSPEKITAAHGRLSNIPFPNEKLRSKTAGYTAEFDYFDLLKSYTNKALEQIHMAPYIAKLHEMIDFPLVNLETGKKTWRLKDKNPSMYTYLHNFEDFLIHGTNLDLSESKFKLKLGNTVKTVSLEGIMQAASRNLGFGVLAGNLRSALVQLGALRLTVHQLGLPTTVKGAGLVLEDIFTAGQPGKINRLAQSQVLDTRHTEALLSDVTAAMIGHNPKDFITAIKEGQIGKLRNTVGNAGYKLMEYTDAIAAHVTWEAANEYATKKLKYDKTQAGFFADDTVVMTQGGTMPGDLARVQRSVAGRFGTQFQRFLISEWNYFTNEVLGETTTSKALRKVTGESAPNKYAAMTENIIKFVAITTAINSLLEGVDEIGYKGIGINTPFPTPIRAVKRGIEANDNILELAGRLAGSIVEPIPFIGSTRYGKGFAGPVLETVHEAVQSAKGTPLSYDLSKPDDSVSNATTRLVGSPFGKIAGIPAAGQIGKYLRGRERGESVYKSLTGYYDEPATGGEGGGIRRIGGPGSGGLRRLR